MTFESHKSYGAGFRVTDHGGCRVLSAVPPHVTVVIAAAGFATAAAAAADSYKHNDMAAAGACAGIHCSSSTVTSCQALRLSALALAGHGRK